MDVERERGGERKRATETGVKEGGRERERERGNVRKGGERD